MATKQVEAAATAVVPDDGNRKRMRSPAYPFINLETAISRAKLFYDKEQRNAAPIKVAVKHWGYEPKSSGGVQTVAALISFGLMTDEGTGEGRRVKLTPNALRIILDTRQDSTDRAEAIKAVALTPKIHQQLWRKWGNDRPSDDNMRHELILNWKPPFNENVVDSFIKEYKDTIAFAKPDDSAIVPLGGEDENGNEVASEVKVGDFVQWESNGVLRFPEAKRVTRIDVNAGYAFVDGYHSGLPTSELIAAEAPAHNKNALLPPVIPIRNVAHQGIAMKQDVFSIAEGEVVISWPTPLSIDSINDLKDWLKIVERKIARSLQEPKQGE